MEDRGPFAAVSTQTSEAVMQEINHLEQLRVDAYLKRDLESLKRLLPEHFTFTRPSGIVLNKAQLLKVIESGELTFESFERSCEKVKVHLNSASTTGLDTVKGRYKERDITGQYRFSNTYVRRQGQWVVVAAHASQATPD
ncbi:MAG: nuclear transport factor 2 family protein [Pyrinomonadaceae bacterium]